MIDAVRTFQACSLGSGSFGRWTLDDSGLPAYDYALDEQADARASFFNTEGLDRRDHWHQFGNRRVTAIATNDGTVEVTTQDRGETYLNKYDESQHNYAGGFSYLDDGTETWNTAYKWRPKGATTQRRFGIDYVQTSTAYRDVTLTRRTFAPDGGWSSIIDEVTIENTGVEEKVLKHYEYWDVARRPIEINWGVSGIPITDAPEKARKARDARNSLFIEDVEWAPDQNILGVRRGFVDPASAPPIGDPNPVDYYPGDPYLALLLGDASEVYADQEAFFGKGGVAAPDTVTNRKAGTPVKMAGRIGSIHSSTGQTSLFVVKTSLILEPGEKKTMRFAYGYASAGSPYPINPVWRDADRDLFKEAQQSLRHHLFYFSSDKSASLQRELAWHAAQIEASVGFREYFGVNAAPQGSAYLYLHGADGAARDLSLFAVPLSYIDAALAKDELRLNMLMTYAADHRIAYAVQGNGVLDDALGAHKEPSDLTLFFLFALSEYIGATGDEQFLNEAMPYYPIDNSDPSIVWDHVVAAVRYLFDTVGTGEHGLVRLGDGDWSDGISFEAPNRNVAIAKGESVPNTQMAVAILPRVADLIDPRDPMLAAEVRAKVDAYRAALAATWTGSFYGRAYFGDGKLAYDKTLNLEAQVWALIGDTFTDKGDRAKLIDAIEKQLDDTSPAGATLLPKGQVWPAISGLLTWGYAVTRDDLAWKHLMKNTMTAHAEAFPDVWYGIWSGPDGLNGPDLERPGETWYSPVTPMVDFPVMNNNQHAMPLLAALRVAGIEATAGGIEIAPHVPGRHFALSTELVDLNLDGDILRGVYRPGGFSIRTLDVLAPPGKTIATATLGGVPQMVAPGARSIRMMVNGGPGKATAFEVTTQ